LRRVRSNSQKNVIENSKVFPGNKEKTSAGGSFSGTIGWSFSFLRNIGLAFQDWI
jgi:hypothetical protein